MRGSESLRWALEYLPEYFTDEPAEFHEELMGDLESGEKRLIARVAPRGHAKSTCAAFAYPLWCVCEGRRRNIVIITHESSLAVQFVRDIRNELEFNERIIADYGDLCRDEGGGDGEARERADRDVGKKKQGRKKWAEAKFTTTNGATVQAKGSGAGLRGVRVGPNRPDLIICDDIEKDELVATPEGRRKLEHWLRRVVTPALSPEGQLLALGSLIHYDSLLANLRDRRRFPRWDYRVYRALEGEKREDGNFYRTALWPARWPVHKLDEERERVGSLAFEQEYQANPIEEGMRAFRPEWLKRYDPSELDERELVHVMAVDPATGASGGDYFALWVGGVHRVDGRIYTRVLRLERAGIVQQIKAIVEAFLEWRPVKIGIETTAYQVALKDMLDDYSRKHRLYMPIVRLQSTKNKVMRIEGSSAVYEKGMFLLPRTLDPEVESQFLHFPKARHDDAPDVCSMGIELVRDYLPRGGSVGEIWRNEEDRGRGW